MALENKLRADIANLKAELQTEIAVIKTKVGDLATKAELSDMPADILRWTVGAIGFQTVVNGGALITLVRSFVK